MSFSTLLAENEGVGFDLHSFVAELYPICRSITGNGVRETLARIAQRIPLVVHEVPTGTAVLDWTIPKEWNIRDAYIKNDRGERVVDFQHSNLHVVSYSIPVHASLDLAELRSRLFTIPDRPDWIPYRTTYYKEDWGFCLSHRQLMALTPGRYEVAIDSVLEDGHLTYGECFLPGASDDEVLITCHVCHPSLCNDNLSSVAVVTALAAQLSALSHRLSYRFLFIPGTIGALTWLARNEAHVDRIRHGLVLACVGDPGGFTYKRSRRGTAAIDRVVEHVLRETGQPHQVVDFSPWGYDERQFCSPGFNLPVGALSRTPHGCFPEYHTSADNPDFVTAESLAGSLDLLLRIADVLENDGTFLNLAPKGEPQLGRRGLYPSVGGVNTDFEQRALLWVLNFSDGDHSLLDIAERANLPFDTVSRAAQRLVNHGLLAERHRSGAAKPDARADGRL